MKNKLLIISILCFLFSLQYTIAKEKNFNKTFQANKHTVLDIDNKYGDVTINNWEKDEISIDVKIIVETSKDEKTEKILSNISIDFDKKGNTVIAHTKFTPFFLSTKWITKLISKDKVVVEYNVNAPQDIIFDIKLKQGNLKLDKIFGNVSVDLRNGSFLATKLAGANNLKFKISDVQIDTLVTGNVNLSNSILEIGFSDKAYLTSINSSIIINKSNFLELKSLNDNIKISESDNIYGKLDFTRFTCKNIKDIIDIKSTFGKTNFMGIEKDFSLIKINQVKTKTNLNFNENSCYKLEIDHNKIQSKLY